MNEKNIQELAIRMGVITVEDMNQYTIVQLVVKIANKVNELVNEVWRFETDAQDIVKTQNDNIQYLLGEGLHLEVANIFDGWVQDGTFDKLLNQSALNKVNNRIDETNAQLSKKLNKDAVLSMANMGQDVKEAMTGGSVAVVGKGMINEENIISHQVVPHHLTFLKTRSVNQFDKSRYEYGFLNNHGGVNASDDYITTHYIPVFKDVSVTISKNTRLYDLYDTTYKLLSDGFHDMKGNTEEELTFTPTVDGFLRVSFAKGDINEFQVSYTDSLQPYEDYQLESNLFHMTSIDEVEFLSRKLMAYDKTSVNNEIGFIGTGGIITGGTSGSTYSTTHFIPIKKGDYVYINSSRKIGLYFQNKKFYGMQSDAIETDYTFKAPLNGLMRVSTQTTNMDNLIVAIKDSEFTVPYPTMENVGGYGWQFDKGINPHPNSISIEDLSPEIFDAFNKSSNITGKTIYNFGDSIAAGDGNGGNGYSELIGEKYNCTVVDFAVGGSTMGWIDGQGTKNILQQINDATARGGKPDFILLDGGTNDIADGGRVPLGAISGDGNYSTESLDNKTYCGAFEIALYNLRNAFPNAKIIYVRVHKMNTREISLQISYGDAAQSICNKWSIPVADIFNKGQLNTFLPCMFRYSNPTSNAPSGDRTHPNEEGYTKFYLPIIENLMNSI